MADQKYAIKADTCPYCGAPYTLADGGCRARCTEMARHHALVAEAAEYEEMRPREELG